MWTNSKTSIEIHILRHWFLPGLLWGSPNGSKGMHGRGMLLCWVAPIYSAGACHRINVYVLNKRRTSTVFFSACSLHFTMCSAANYTGKMCLHDTQECPNLILYVFLSMACDNVLLKTLCYKQESRGLETRWREWIFFNLRNPSSRTRLNEFQKQKNNVSANIERPVRRAEKFPWSLIRLYRRSGILNLLQPYRPPRPVTEIALLYGDGVCSLWGTNWTISTATSSQYLAVNCEPIA
jgi:hypothetical protein